MAVGLSKCDRIATTRGRIVRAEEVSLPDGNIALIKDSYMYLNLPQATRNLEEAIKK